MLLGRRLGNQHNPKSTIIDRRLADQIPFEAELALNLSRVPVAPHPFAGKLRIGMLRSSVDRSRNERKSLAR